MKKSELRNIIREEIYKLSKDTTIKINGIPWTTKEDVNIEGHENNLEISNLVEEENMSAEEFAGMIQKVMDKYFPKSTTIAKYSNKLTEAIYVSFRIGQKKDWSNGIKENAPAEIILWIWNVKDGKVTENMSMEPSQAGVVIKPVKNPYLAYERVKFPARKTRGDYKKILKAIDLLFSRSKDILKKTVPAMTDDHQWVKKYL